MNREHRVLAHDLFLPVKLANPSGQGGYRRLWWRRAARRAGSGQTTRAAYQPDLYRRPAITPFRNMPKASFPYSTWPNWESLVTTSTATNSGSPSRSSIPKDFLRRRRSAERQVDEPYPVPHVPELRQLCLTAETTVCRSGCLILTLMITPDDQVITEGRSRLSNRTAP